MDLGGTLDWLHIFVQETSQTSLSLPSYIICSKGVDEQIVLQILLLDSKDMAQNDTCLAESTLSALTQDLDFRQSNKQFKI